MGWLGRAGGRTLRQITRTEEGWRYWADSKMWGLTECYREGVGAHRVEVGRWVDGMSGGSVLMAGGGLSSKNKNFLAITNSQWHKETQNVHVVCLCVYVCVWMCFCVCIFTNKAQLKTQNKMHVNNMNTEWRQDCRENHTKFNIFSGQLTTKLECAYLRCCSYLKGPILCNFS